MQLSHNKYTDVLDWEFEYLFIDCSDYSRCADWPKASGRQPTSTVCQILAFKHSTEL